ncbi:hypothetical protein B4113_0112 [Geobacillus sp. B4113_201601]|nr:hypothetical protein B4113_0112 [Geobacillus sp. B4113_201601]
MHGLLICTKNIDEEAPLPWREKRLFPKKSEGVPKVFA